MKRWETSEKSLDPPGSAVLGSKVPRGLETLGVQWFGQAQGQGQGYTVSSKLLSGMRLDVLSGSSRLRDQLSLQASRELSILEHWMFDPREH